MKQFSIWMAVAALLCGMVLIGRANGDDKPDGPPPKQDGGARGRGPEGGGPGGPGGPPPGGFHLIPRFVAEKLELTDDQKQQIGELEKECKNKLAKILTPEQMKTLETARPPRGGPGQGGARGGQGGGAAGHGGPDGGKGGPGGGDQDGPPKRQQPPSN